MRLINKAHEYTIYAFFFSLNFETLNFLNLNIDFLATKITISILLFISILNFKTFFSVKHFFRYLIPLLFYFILLTYISFINKSSSYREFFDFPFFLNILIFLILINSSRIKYEVLLRGLFIFALSTFFLSILYYLGFGFTETSVDLEGRASVFGMNQNLLGIHLCVSLLTLISIISENKLELGKERYSLILIFPVLLGFMISTGSRLALLSLISGIFIFVFFNKNIKTKQKILVVFVSSFAFLAFWQLFLKNSLVVGRLLDTVNDGDLAYRDVIWGSLLNVFSNNFIFGVGRTGYAMIVGGTSPHNVLIEVLCYTGIIGLFFFILFVLSIVSNAYKRIKKDRELLPMALVIPILGMILSGQIFGPKIFWALFAYIAGSISITNKSYKNIDRNNKKPTSSKLISNNESKSVKI